MQMEVQLQTFWLPMNQYYLISLSILEELIKFI